ncbi:hypothetical protein KFK09_003889 [Dendrobium nobile]|uniref:Reverse transcriptase zinc-binding domain-containing protein n=1 Tax=Dendrobium nobile TaxID=94219 RepID=A0A8T3BYW6_DENNO|nr:hypothetical protein KFK09_003889 [Dendrobium nobile]
MNGKSISALLFENSVILNATNQMWSWVKKGKLNPKVETFWWRVFHIALPTYTYLENRRLQRDRYCPRRCNDLENIELVVTKCGKIKEVIKQVRKWGFIIPACDSISDYCNWLSSQSSFMINIYCNMIYFT